MLGVIFRVLFKHCIPASGVPTYPPGTLRGILKFNGNLIYPTVLRFGGILSFPDILRCSVLPYSTVALSSRVSVLSWPLYPVHRTDTKTHLASLCTQAALFLFILISVAFCNFVTSIATAPNDRTSSTECVRYLLQNQN